jgi:hypothetical protein
MTTTAALTATQFKTAATVLSLAVLAENGEVSEYAARTNGAWLPALKALVGKGVLTRTKRPFVMPVGLYAGETFDMWFYSVAA